MASYEESFSSGYTSLLDSEFSGSELSLTATTAKKETSDTPCDPASNGEMKKFSKLVGKGEGSSSSKKKKDSAPPPHAPRIPLKEDYCQEVFKYSFDEERLEDWFREKRVVSFQEWAIRIVQGSVDKEDLPVNALLCNSEVDAEDREPIRRFICMMVLSACSPQYEYHGVSHDDRLDFMEYADYYVERMRQYGLHVDVKDSSGSGYLPAVKNFISRKTTSAEGYKVDWTKQSKFDSLRHRHLSFTPLPGVQEGDESTNR